MLKTPIHPAKAAHGVVDRLAYGAVCVAMVLGCAAQAQTIYRSVGADGRVTFSDKAPIATDNATVLVPGGRSVALGAATLPLELRQVVGKFPVTLFTSGNCMPCNSGRDLLGNRGIPFSERTVTTTEDSEALQRISGATSLPLLTIGSQQIKGYSESEWTQFLDAAGYPKSSVLPGSYRAPPATPLVVLQTAAPSTLTVKPEEVQPPRPPAEQSQEPNNPAGIRF